MVKATIRIQSMVRGKVERKRFAANVTSLMRRREEVKRCVQEKVRQKEAEERARKEEAAREEALQALLANEAAKERETKEGGNQERKSSVTVSPEMAAKLQKLMDLEELERKLQVRHKIELVKSLQCSRQS